MPCSRNMRCLQKDLNMCITFSYRPKGVDGFHFMHFLNRIDSSADEDDQAESL